jgi:hypothetical protein
MPFQIRFDLADAIGWVGEKGLGLTAITKQKEIDGSRRLSGRIVDKSNRKQSRI